MPTLAPCSTCNRHVRLSESSCPFCQTELSQTAGPRRTTPAGRITRAAIFAGTLAGAAACSGGDDSGDGDTSKDAAQQGTVDAAPIADADLTQPDAKNIQPDANPNQPDSSVPMPYGAPPARRRLV